MEYKRLEIYTGWKCNHKCVFCIEYPTMEQKWETEVTREEIMKKLIKYRKKKYNHVTFLGGEPLIHPILYFATRFAKKIGYTTLVATNASLLQFSTQAQKQLPYIDQLFISIPIIDSKLQPHINQTQGIINFDRVFDNINTFWKGNFLKVNTVIHHLNLNHIDAIIDYIGKKGVRELSLTYPDLNLYYYGKEYSKDIIAPKYSDVKKYIVGWFIRAKQYNIRLICTDIPLCLLPDISYIPFTDDVVYQTRLKINAWDEIWDRKNRLPRARAHVKTCTDCSKKDICWGPSVFYEEMYGLDEITPYSIVDGTF